LDTIRREGEVLQKTRDRLIQSQVQQKLAETIKQDVEKQFDVRVKRSEVFVFQSGEKESPAIQRVQLVIAPRRNEGGDVMPVQPVEPVVIGLDRSSSAVRDSPSSPVPSRIADYLQQKWELSPEQVHVTWEDAS